MIRQEGLAAWGLLVLLCFWWRSSDFSQAKMKIYRRSVCFDLAREMSSGKLRWRMEQCIFCLQFAGSGGIRSRAPMFLFRPFGSGGSVAKLYSVLTSGDFLVHGEVRRRNIMKAGLVDWLKEVRVSVMLRDLLGVPGSAAVVCIWARQHK